MNVRLALYAVLGLGGCVAVIGGGLAGNWLTFGVGLVWAGFAEVMLLSGYWMRWP